MPHKTSPLAVAGMAALIVGAALAVLRERPRVFQPPPPPAAVETPQPATTLSNRQTVSPASPIIPGVEERRVNLLDGLVSGVAPPVRSPPPRVPPILRDLLSRVPKPDYWRDTLDPTCPVTWAHEASHGMMAMLTKGDGFSIYLLDGKAIKFDRHPSVTIGEVAASVPPDDRGPIFDLYMVRQRKDWDKQPLYLLDEWNSYIHGSIARRQAGLQRRQETENYAREMERYCREMLRTVERRDPGYPQLNMLRGFIDYQAQRLADLTTDVKW